MVKTSGPGEYHAYELAQDQYFYSNCKVIYDSRIHENASNSGLMLKPGSYKLEVIGARGGSYFRHLNGLSLPIVTSDRGDNGGEGSYAQGVLKLSEDTMVYPWYGYGGMNQYLSEKICDESVVNCGQHGYSTFWTSDYGCDGGGASDIRIGTNDIYHRVIIGAGGGGDGNYKICGPHSWSYVFCERNDMRGQSVTNWQATPDASGTNPDYYKMDDSLVLFSEQGGGGGGLYVKYLDTNKEIEGVKIHTSSGGPGGVGFVWTEGVKLSDDAASLMKLDDKYKLTEVCGYVDEENCSCNEWPELISWSWRVTNEGAGDGAVLITTLPRK